MPQLKSGRHVALSASPLIDQLKFGTDVEISAVVIAYRLTISSAHQLRDFLTVGYFREGEEPPEARSYNSGFLVKDVLAGKADWSQEEIQEFEAWLNANTKLNDWLTEQFNSINVAIRDNLVWDSPFWIDDESERPNQ